MILFPIIILTISDAKEVYSPPNNDNSENDNVSEGNDLYTYVSIYKPYYYYRGFKGTLKVGYTINLLFDAFYANLCGRTYNYSIDTIEESKEIYIVIWVIEHTSGCFLAFWTDEFEIPLIFPSSGNWSVYCNTIIQFEIRD